MVAHVFNPSIWEAESYEFEDSQSYIVRDPVLSQPPNHHHHNRKPNKTKHSHIPKVRETSTSLHSMSQIYFLYH